MAGRCEEKTRCGMYQREVLEADVRKVNLRDFRVKMKSSDTRIYCAVETGRLF